MMVFLTALLANGTALLNFLATPEGQKVAAMNTELVGKIIAFADKMHNRPEAQTADKP